MYQTENTRITEIRAVATPTLVSDENPITEQIATMVHDTRQQIHRILNGDDDRLLVVTGPCSIHDVDAAVEYAQQVAKMREKFGSELCVIMRVYFEKPRTTVGWKGLINDPDLNETFNINKGIKTARKLLLDLNAIGVPAGTEFLDVVTPQYVADLVSWGAIGARTTESQVHREMTSGLSCPVGLKNGTNGDLKIAVDAILSASRPHHFLSMTAFGHSAIFSTAGNEDCHIILRGGSEPNFDAESVEQASQMLESNGLPSRVMIDFSHANSSKQHRRQIDVGNNVAAQISAGDKRIVGVMIESNLVEGNQKVVQGQPLVYGQSITDACLSIEDTWPLIETLATSVKNRRNANLEQTKAAV